MMICAHCGKPIGETKPICKAGPKDTAFCSKKCVYQAFGRFYTKEELNKTMKIIIPPRTK